MLGFLRLERQVTGAVGREIARVGAPEGQWMGWWDGANLSLLTNSCAYVRFRDEGQSKPDEVGRGVSSSCKYCTVVVTHFSQREFITPLR